MAMDRAAFDELYRGQQASMAEEADDTVEMPGSPVRIPKAALGAGVEDIALQAGEVVEGVNKRTGERRRGVVLRIVKGYITVAFDDAPGSPRRFPYPKAFQDGFLTLAK